MIRNIVISVFAFILVHSMASQSHALLISGQDIISAPASVMDDPPGAVNTHQQAFNERQNFYLTSDLSVDGGIISADTTVNSHMIFLNSLGTTFIQDLNVIWGFDGLILGVMSDVIGTEEVSSSPLLGAIGTIYPAAPFAKRGMEPGDSYTVSGSTITVSMNVTEPGDWIRVVTAASAVPEPSTLFLLGSGLLGLSAFRKKFKK